MLKIDYIKLQIFFKKIPELYFLKKENEKSPGNVVKESDHTGKESMMKNKTFFCEIFLKH